MKRRKKKKKEYFESKEAHCGKAGPLCSADAHEALENPAKHGSPSCPTMPLLLRRKKKKNLKNYCKCA